MIKFFQVKDITEYYRRLRDTLEFTPMWYHLNTKSEYGSEKSEKGYQQLAVSLSGKIARQCNANDKLAEALTICRASFFPKFGKQGIRAIMEYLKNHDQEISRCELARLYVEYHVSQSPSVVTAELDALLKELFDDDKTSDIPEVEIAKVSCNAFELIKPLGDDPNIDLTSLLNKASEYTLQACIEAKKPTQSAALRDLSASVSLTRKAMTEDEKQEYFQTLDAYSEFEKDILRGVCEFIALN